MRLLLLICIVSSFTLAACSKRLSKAEVQSMTTMNEGWRDDIGKMAAVIQASSIKYAETHPAAPDSAFAASHAQDNAFFKRWFGIALAGVNRLEMLVQANADWIVRLQAGKTPLTKAQRAWDASRMVFYENHQKAKAVIDQYESVTKNWKPIAAAPTLAPTLPTLP